MIAIFVMLARSLYIVVFVAEWYRLSDSILLFANLQVKNTLVLETGRFE